VDIDGFAANFEGVTAVYGVTADVINQFRPNGAVELAYRTDKEKGTADV
jgi:hypothetical protein